MYTITLMHVTGKYTTGKWAHTGRIAFCKAIDLVEAKAKAASEMSVGYFNYANIVSNDEEVNIERLFGREWEKVA